MQEQRKNINKVLLWLTGLLFLSHGLLPHHHHFDSVFAHAENQQQEGHTAKHSGEIPAHCHAFNMLIIEKPGISGISTAGKVAHSDFVANNDDHFCVNKNNSGGSKLFNRHDIPLALIFPDNSPTRGSPAFT